MIATILFLLILLYAIATYNSLTRKRNNVENAFGAIDAMLKKKIRSDSESGRHCTAIRRT